MSTPDESASADAGRTETPTAPTVVDWAWWPYVVPMGLFLLLTEAEWRLPKGPGGAPHVTWYPIGYAVKVLVVTIAAWLSRSAWRDLRPRPGPGGWLPAVGVGLAVTIAWIGLDALPYPRFGDVGKRQAFDPGMLAPAARIGFLAVRLFGLVLLVPLIEELFWRSFLIRWLIDPDFQKVPIGKVTPVAAAVVSVLFAAAHPAEWLPALLTGFAWAGVLWKTKSVSACVVSHAVANLVLGIYVLATGAYWFW